MRTFNLSLLAAFLLSTGTLCAQNLGEIRGRVYAPDGTAQISANVYATINGELVGTVTDLDGRFVLKPLPPGLHGLTISYAGLENVEFAAIEVTADRATYVGDVHMHPKTLRGAEVIAWKRKLIEKDDPSRMSLLATEIAKLPVAKNPVQLISTQFAGVTAAPNGDGLYFRGSRTENMASYIDGVKVSGAVPRIPPSAISSISVYTGGLPARYGDVTGGVIVIETKTYAEMLQYARRQAARQETQDVVD
ncbi:MAG: carboxypeptidase regulatory-like domain-containing protein [Flavobacteriales bacterium]|nr:carboxypeptidase regulatory-like domain-containing protein [Flavobacteriales bacterium]MCC6938908.1 carboxypeptidase regulatory-like domain-containing protein [Flavobacteriales bacterium]